MSPTYLLRIDVKKLAARLSDAERRRVSHGDAFAWLVGRGFKTCRRGWAVEALTATLRDPDDAALTFWFEDGGEARRFMLKWMPLRCT